MYWYSLIICILVSSVYSVNKIQFRLTGLRKPNQIVGGRDPKKGELKYVVAIHSNGSLCGGGIIDKKFVLTAAHCVFADKYDKLLKPIRIVAGASHAFGYNKADVIEMDVVKAYLPQVYEEDSLSDDIAVLELKEELDLMRYHDKIAKLYLPEANKSLYEYGPKYPTYEKERVKFAGYGNTRVYKVYVKGEPQIRRLGAGPLKVANAQIDDLERCRYFFSEARPEKTMCLSVIEDSDKTRPQGTCTGDSGSPAIYNDSVVIGLDSTGMYCDNNGAPTLFTRVSYYIPFIHQAMSGNPDGIVCYVA